MLINPLDKIGVIFILLALCTVSFAQSAGFDINRMDKSVNACDNFYQYANGNWLKKTEIPAAYPSWGNSVNQRFLSVSESLFGNSKKVSGNR